jgi:Holliday junction resolvase RusA-like endonuclease
MSEPDKSKIVRGVRLVIWGQCYSMKNSKIPRRNAPGMVKHPKARQFEHDFLAQVDRSRQLELGSRTKPLRATVRVFYPSRRQDADVELVFDLLQKAHVIRNDRYITEKHIYAGVDKKNPRVEIEVEEI